MTSISRGTRCSTAAKSTWAQTSTRHSTSRLIQPQRTARYLSTSTILPERSPISPIWHTQRRNSSSPLNTCSTLTQRRNFTNTSIRQRDHHFDTLKLVQRLRDDGFTEEQASATMKVLGDVIEERCQTTS